MHVVTQIHAGSEPANPDDRTICLEPLGQPVECLKPRKQGGHIG